MKTIKDTNRLIIEVLNAITFICFEEPEPWCKLDRSPFSEWDMVDIINIPIKGIISRVISSIR